MFTKKSSNSWWWGFGAAFLSWLSFGWKGTGTNNYKTDRVLPISHHCQMNNGRELLEVRMLTLSQSLRHNVSWTFNTHLFNVRNFMFGFRSGSGRACSRLGVLQRGTRIIFMNPVRWINMKRKKWVQFNYRVQL